MVAVPPLTLLVAVLVLHLFGEDLAVCAWHSETVRLGFLFDCVAR